MPINSIPVDAEVFGDQHFQRRDHNEADKLSVQQPAFSGWGWATTNEGT
jgi:hypothetical protein